MENYFRSMKELQIANYVSEHSKRVKEMKEENERFLHYSLSVENDFNEKSFDEQMKQRSSEYTDYYNKVNDPKYLYLGFFITQRLTKYEQDIYDEQKVLFNQTQTKWILGHKINKYDHLNRAMYLEMHRKYRKLTKKDLFE